MSCIVTQFNILRHECMEKMLQMFLAYLRSERKLRVCSDSGVGLPRSWRGRGRAFGVRISSFFVFIPFYHLLLSSFCYCIPVLISYFHVSANFFFSAYLLSSCFFVSRCLYSPYLSLYQPFFRHFFSFSFHLISLWPSSIRLNTELNRG